MSRAAAVALLVLLLTLSGCFGGGGKKKEVVNIIPDGITQQDLDRVEQLTSIYPTQYLFPGQQALEPAVVWFNGTLAQGTGSTGIEMPNDDGQLDYNAAIVEFDLAEHVAVGQPVEVRVNLKWWGNPGTSADLDIWADMPGEHGAYTGPRYDESMNWNIINKQRVIDAVHVEGEPFKVGLQVNNGRIIHPDGVDYSVKVELHFVKDVLAAGAAYAIQVPDNATLLVVDTDRVVGDEHVDLDYVIVGPNDQRIVSESWNDIQSETKSIPVRGGGEYVIYSPRMHGGFLRFESDIPSAEHTARLLTLTKEERVLFEGPAPSPGTYAEQSQASSNTFGTEATFDVGPSFPLDIIPFVRSQAGSVDAAINITSPKGWLATAYARGSYTDDSGRVGPTGSLRFDRSALEVGSYGYGIVSNSAGTSLGVTIVSYTR